MMDYKENAKIQGARRRFESREMIFDLKSRTSCIDCGHKFHPSQIDIVRKNGERSIQLSKVLHKSRKFIMDEIEKCDFICANCNRLRTWNFQRKSRSRD